MTGLSNILFAGVYVFKLHSIDNRFVTGLSNILFAGVYVFTFPPGHFTVWGSEGVNGLLGTSVEIKLSMAFG